jgi:hypothetical protein
MHISQRTVLGLGALLLLGAFVFLARSYKHTRAEPVGESEGSVSVAVTNGADRGAGSLREALFIAAGARGSATILIRVGHIAVETALPPLLNAHGMTITAQAPGTTIDARSLSGGAVFDVAGANTSITGVTVRNCPDAAVLLRAGRFRLMSTTIESCDVGIDIAENANDFLLERNRFMKNRIGIRFAATNRNATLVHNEFAENADGGVWAVRGALDLRKDAPISVRSNKFDGDRAGIVAGNVSLLIEDNDLDRSREAGIHLVGAGAVVRGNRVRDGAAMGIVAENASDVLVENNELDHLAAYAIMVRASAGVVIRANRIHNCGYGMAFVLGDEAHPSTAVDNSLIALRHDGIDVIGDSPILRRNRVSAQVVPLHTEDLEQGAKKIHSNPFLDNNTFEVIAAAVTVETNNGSKAGIAPR